MSKAITYFKEAKQELAKVTWPDRNKTVETSIVVLACAGVFAIVLFGYDMLFSEIFHQLFYR